MNFCILLSLKCRVLSDEDVDTQLTAIAACQRLGVNKPGTSQRRHVFVTTEPLKGQSVTYLPGIGPTLGQKLAADRFDKAADVLGKFLVMEKNEQHFVDWLTKYGADSDQVRDCYRALRDWCNAFQV